MLKRKRTKESGSQAPAPEGKTKRGSPVEQLRERSREGRKETIRKPSTKTGGERMGNQPGRNGESKEARAEAGTGEAAVRRNREEKERKKQRLSSEMLKAEEDERNRKPGTGPGEET